MAGTAAPQKLKDRRAKRRPAVGSWDDVIALAKARIESLKAAIEIFEGYRDSGEPFTSGEATEREAMKNANQRAKGQNQPEKEKK